MPRLRGLPLLVVLACGWAPLASAAGTALKSELAGRLLQLHLRASELQAALAPEKYRRGHDAQRIERHIAFLAHLLRESGDEGVSVRAAQVGLDFAGVGLDLIRTDLEATRRGMGGVVRHDCDTGINFLWEGMAELEKDPGWVTPGHVESVMHLPLVARAQAMTVAPIANVMKAGVLAANIVDSAAATALLIGTLPGTLSRIATWMRSVRVERAVLDVAGTARLGMVALSEAGALVLTDAEVIALAQCGKLAQPALSLYMMSRGGSGKLPDAQSAREWVSGLDKRAAPTHNSAFNYQVRQCGPTEVQVVGGGKKVWTDGIRVQDGHLLEAKHVGDVRISPYVKESAMPEPLKLKIAQQEFEQFEAYAAVIKDPKTPVVALEVITNEAKAAPYFQQLLDRLEIPGQVIVRP